MDKQKIYQEIRNIALQLQKEKNVYTRADVAYELKKFGIEKDSTEVSRLVWGAYVHFDKDAIIRLSFYDNEKKRLLVDGCQLEHLIESAENNVLFPLLQKELQAGDHSLQALEHAVTHVTTKTVLAKAGEDLLGTVVGTQGVAKVQNEATSVLNAYSELVCRYDDAKHQVKYLMADFAKLREQVCDIYRRQTMVLVDAFGDIIKTVEPQLFDFDLVEWLDVQGMLQQIKLDYDRIAEKCSALISEISESFSQSLQNASSSYRSAGSKKAGLLLAALNMASHYIDVGQKTTQMKQELLVLKNSVKHDVTIIKGDMERLGIIYKTLNDLYIPQSEVFCRFSRQVMSAEWQKLEEYLYTDPAVKTLKQRRDHLLDEIRKLGKDMADAEMNINYYTTHIDECKQLLESLHEHYEQASKSKPCRPSALSNLFTFWKASTKYNRNIYEWNRACKPVVSRFEDLQVDVKLDCDELKQLQSDLDKNRQRYQTMRQELSQQNRQLLERIQVNSTLRAAMLPHLEAMIKLLRMGRKIAESKLDRKLTKSVSIVQQNTELPVEVRQNLATLTTVIRKEAHMEEESMYRLVNGSTDATPGSETPQTEIFTEEDMNQLTDAGNTALQSTVGLLEAWSNLQAMRAQNVIAYKAYDEELAKLQNSFRRNLADIDNKTAVLRESIRRMNMAGNYDQLKEELLSLAGENDTFTEEDWQQIFEGKNKIEL